MNQSYLVRIRKPSTYHLWNNQLNDSVCKLYSTSLVKTKYHLIDIHDGLTICHMCETLDKKNINVVG